MKSKTRLDLHARHVDRYFAFYLVPADVSLDPLLSYQFEKPPVYSCAIDVILANNVLTITTQNLQLPATIQVACSVSENGLPAAYGTTLQTSIIVPIYGWIRKMDNRFQQDLRACGEKLYEIVRSGIKQRQKTVPIPIGDPGQKIKKISLEGVLAEQDRIREILFLADKMNERNVFMEKQWLQYAGSLITSDHQDRVHSAVQNDKNNA